MLTAPDVIVYFFVIATTWSLTSLAVQSELHGESYLRLSDDVDEADHLVPATFTTFVISNGHDTCLLCVAVTEPCTLLLYSNLAVFRWPLMLWS